MMYFSWNPGTVVDEENRPVVAGRVSVFVHDSNVLATVYTMEGDQYVQAQNPQFLDDYGRLQATLFAELGVYDVKIEKASGDTYEDFDHFAIGLDAKLDQVGRDSVKSVEELMDLDPSVSSGIVTVESYPVRNYLWDPDAIDTVLSHYAGYIRYFSKINGQVNSEVEDYVKQRLIAALFKFRFDR